MKGRLVCGGPKHGFNGISFPNETNSLNHRFPCMTAYQPQLNKKYHFANFAKGLDLWFSSLYVYFFCSPLGKSPIFTSVPVQDFFGNSMRESSISAGDTQWKHRVFMPIGSLVWYRYRFRYGYRGPGFCGRSCWDLYGSMLKSQGTQFSVQLYPLVN